MTLEPGDPVGDRFIVEALLGEGGTARVYRVRHTTLGSLHALKLLAPESGTSPARLLQEGRIQATLRHPCVVPVTDVVHQEGRLGLVMEYVPGPSLADLLARRGLSQEEALALFARILAGVCAAHTSGVLHRDLKPHNVLLAPLTGGWLPKVADFGIARAVGSGARRTRVGFSIGTPGYMAPEQAMGRADVDQRADVYALGVVLFEMLTGELPGSEEPGAPPPDEASVRSRLPEGAITETILAALTTEVAARLPDIPTFAHSLYAEHPQLRAIALGEAPASPVPLDEGSGLQAVPRANATLVASLTFEEDRRTFGSGTGQAPAPRPATAPSLAPAATKTNPARRYAGALLGFGLVGGLVLAGGTAVLGGFLLGRPDPTQAPAAIASPAAPVQTPNSTAPGGPTLATTPAQATTPSPGDPPEAPASAAVAPANPPQSAGGVVTAPTAPASPPSAGAAVPASPTVGVPPATPTQDAVTQDAVADAAVADAAVAVSPAPAAAAPTLPTVQGVYVGMAGGRPARVRLARGDGAGLRAEVTLTLGVTDRTLRYMGALEASGAVNLMEDGGSGRLVGTVQNGVLNGTVSIGGGKPLPVRGTLE